jgi:osmotically-inducible protein OsmY
MQTAEQLKNDVEEELYWDPSIHSEQIGVSVRDGVVELDGHVGSFYEKWAAERDALRVADVKSVASEIKVDLSGMPSRTDEDIARAATSQLEWNYLIPDTVKVQVTDGFVTLKGTVEWQFQSDEAERAVRPLLGVTGVRNEIELKPTGSDDKVRTKIEDALKRDAAIDADNVTVEASVNTVTLRGKVQSLGERDEAERVAFLTRGVTKVNNLLQIGY